MRKSQCKDFDQDYQYETDRKVQRKKDKEFRQMRQNKRNRFVG